MSSHHIVRDEQEPALLLWQPEQLFFAQAGELLEWSPRVVVHQQALAEALGWGIKLDAVWGKEEEHPLLLDLVAHQQPVAVFALPADKPLRAVLAWLEKKNQQSVNLIADAAAKDFALLQALEPLQQQLQLQVISQGWRYSFFGKGKAQKWLPAGRRLRLVFFAEVPKVFQQGITICAELQHMQEYQLQEAGMLQLTSGAPFWLGESL